MSDITVSDITICDHCGAQTGGGVGLQRLVRLLPRFFQLTISNPDGSAYLLLKLCPSCLNDLRHWLPPRPSPMGGRPSPRGDAGRHSRDI